MLMSDRSLYVCSSDLSMVMSCMVLSLIEDSDERRRSWASERRSTIRPAMHAAMGSDNPAFSKLLRTRVSGVAHAASARRERRKANFFRSEEHTSELQSLMRISYAVFCLKKKTH